jgi:hypothetical protein
LVHTRTWYPVAAERSATCTSSANSPEIVTVASSVGSRRSTSSGWPLAVVPTMMPVAPIGTATFSPGPSSRAGTASPPLALNSPARSAAS